MTLATPPFRKKFKGHVRTVPGNIWSLWRSHILEANLYTEMNMDSSLIGQSMAVDSSLDRGGGRAVTAYGLVYGMVVIGCCFRY